MIMLESIISLLSGFHGTKEHRALLIGDVVNELNDGHGDPLQVLALIKQVEQFADMLTNTDEKKNKSAAHLARRFRELTMDALQKHGKSATIYGAVLEQKEAGTKYDFSKCGVPGLLNAYTELSDLKEKIKLAEDRLKLIPVAGELIVDEETGEAVRIYPPIKTSTTTIFVSLK